MWHAPRGRQRQARPRVRAERAVPLRIDELRTIVSGIALTLKRAPTDLMVRRGRALMLGWSAAMRESELVGSMSRTSPSPATRTP